MKRIVALLSVAIFATAVFAFAADEGTPEPSPIQKLMRARAAWMAAMKKNLEEKRFAAAAEDAVQLAAETKTTAENIGDPLNKEITLAISTLATDLSAAAAGQDGDAVKAKLQAINGKCNQCHAQLLEKK